MENEPQGIRKDFVDKGIRNARLDREIEMIDRDLRLLERSRQYPGVPEEIAKLEQERAALLAEKNS